MEVVLASVTEQGVQVSARVQVSAWQEPVSAGLGSNARHETQRLRRHEHRLRRGQVRSRLL